MFTQWLDKNDLGNLLTSQELYHPFPTASERDAWENIHEDKKKEIEDLAEKFRDFQWPPLLATQYMAFKRTGNRSLYEDNHFPRRHALSALVIGECLKCDLSYINDIINGTWQICEESFWGVSAHNTPGSYDNNTDALPDYENHYIDLFAAETGSLMAFTLYLLRPQLEVESKRLVQRILFELDERIMKPFLKHEDFWWMGFGGRSVNNWNPWIISNVMMVFLLIEKDKTRREAGIVKALRCLDYFVNSYSDDGGCDEGTSYWNVAGGALFDCLDQLARASDNKITFWDEPLIQQIGKFIYRSYIAYDFFINFADGGARVNIDTEMIYRYGKLINDKKLMGLAAGFTVKEDANTSNVPAPLRRRLPAIFGYNEFKNADKEIYYEQDIWLNGIQVMASRQFHNTTKGLYIAAKGGHNNESHNHNDVGSFVVYYNGLPAIIDIGVETYTKKTFSEQRYDIWTMQSQYHNLPTINNMQQLPGHEYVASNVNYSSNQQETQFSLDIKNAYPNDACIHSYIRSYTFIKGENGHIEIKDDFDFNKENNSLSLNFMTHMKPFLENNGCIKIPVSSSFLSLNYDKDVFSVNIEECDSSDKRLFPIWGNNVYRIVLTAKSLGKIGNVKLSIS